MNALIWVKQGKERLALANISGAMMIQATIPSALGLFFTPWLFDGPLVAAAMVTTLAVIALWALFRRGTMDSRTLASVGLLYGGVCGLRCLVFQLKPDRLPRVMPTLGVRFFPFR